MAYNQRPRFGAPEQGHPRYQEPSYDQRQARGYANGDQGDGHDHRPNYGEPFQNPFPVKHSAPQGPSRYNYDTWVADPTRQRDDRYYNSRSPYSNGEHGGRQDHNADYNQSGLGANGYGNPIPPQNRHRPEGNYQRDQYNSDFDSGATNGYRGPPQSAGRDGDRYAGQKMEPDYHQRSNGWQDSKHNGSFQERQDGRGVPGGSNWPPQNNNPDYGDPYSRHEQPRPHSRPGRDQRPPLQTNQTSHRILENVKSPGTLPWDNPFPTFPAKSRKSAQEEPNHYNGVGDNRPSTQGHDTRTHAATSKYNQGPAHNDRNGPQGGEQWSSRPTAHRQRPSLSRNVYSDSGQVSEENGHLNGELRYTNDHGPEPIYGRHSEDNRARNQPDQPRNLNPGFDRSRTMPAEISDSIKNGPRGPQSSEWQEPGGLSGYHGPEDRQFLPESTRTASRPNTRGRPTAHTNESRSNDDPKSRALPEPSPHSQYQKDRSRGSFDKRTDFAPQAQRPPLFRDGSEPHRNVLSADEMPNFEATQNANIDSFHDMTLDDHLAPPPKRPAPWSQSEHNSYSEHKGYHGGQSYASDPIPRSRSQPDGYDQRPPRSRNEGGFGFGGGDYGGQRPSTSSSNRRPGPPGGYDMGPPANQWENQPRQRPPPNPAGSEQGWGSRPGNPGRMNGPPNDPPNGFSNQRPQDMSSSSRMPKGRGPDHQIQKPSPSPTHRSGPGQPPGPTSANPDALPRHPAPVRPGLAEGSGMSPNNKPAPVRRYDETPSPLPLSGPSKPPGPPPKDDKPGPRPVTYQELDRLRQKVNSNPDDQGSRMTLVKKLVEASTVLVDERANPGTKAKAREDYIMQANKMVKKLASSNYPEAMFYLGDCYSRGSLGLPTDHKEAFTLYQSAAKANHAQAAYRVAVCCEIGQDEGGGTRKDPLKAMQWYKRAAELGDISGMYKMGVIQLKGLLGQPKNPKDALVWLKRAADRADADNPHALHELALIYQNPPNGGGISQDEAQAKRLFIQSASMGYKFSQFRLGTAHEYGQLGCRVDPRQSIAWYSKAAVQEEHQSELALSGWYLTGSEGVLQQSDTEAYLWARKAAQAGLAKAEYAMGYFTEVGIGAPTNIEDAKRWYWRAASQNFPKARERLEELRKGAAVKQSRPRVSRSNMRKQSDGECVVM